MPTEKYLEWPGRPWRYTVTQNWPGTESQGAGAIYVYPDMEPKKSIQAYGDLTLNLGLLGGFTLCKYWAWRPGAFKMNQQKIGMPSGWEWAHAKPWKPCGFSVTQHWTFGPMQAHICLILSVENNTGVWWLALCLVVSEDSHCQAMEPARPTHIHSHAEMSLGGPCRFTVMRPWDCEENSGSQWPGEGSVDKTDSRQTGRERGHIQAVKMANFWILCYPPYLSSIRAFLHP